MGYRVRVASPSEAYLDVLCRYVVGPYFPPDVPTVADRDCVSLHLVLEHGPSLVVAAGAAVEGTRRMQRTLPSPDPIRVAEYG